MKEPISEWNMYDKAKIGDLMPAFELLHGDCLQQLTTLPAASVDAVVCDPPYGLRFMGKDWDHSVPGVAFWAAAMRVAKPGAHLLAFGGTRTFHRLAVAIEDAGWEIRDTVMWVYGSGFPKSHDVSKGIDKRGGYPHLSRVIGDGIKAARESRGLTVGECDKRFCGGTTNWSWFEGRPVGQRAPTPDTFRMIAAEWPELTELANMVAEAEREVVGKYDGSAPGLAGMRFSVTDNLIRQPSSDLARQWDGWGTALKPAWEPIIVARKPLDGTVANNVLTHGVGGINIDGCRVGNEDTRSPASKTALGIMNDDAWKAKKVMAGSANGRFPANLIHDGSDEVLEAFAVAGERKSCNSPSKAKCQSKFRPEQGEYQPQGPIYPGDTGSAARFFYCAKASKADRDEGCEGMQAKQYSHDGRETPIENAYQRNDSKSRNHHPTVKPTKLMKFLCRLITPPAGTVLDPFMGSGSTGKAAVLEGFNFIGIEKDAEYIAIARARIASAISGSTRRTPKHRSSCGERLGGRGGNL